VTVIAGRIAHCCTRLFYKISLGLRWAACVSDPRKEVWPCSTSRRPKIGNLRAARLALHALRGNAPLVRTAAGCSSVETMRVVATRYTRKMWAGPCLHFFAPVRDARSCRRLAGRNAKLGILNGRRPGLSFQLGEWSRLLRVHWSPRSSKIWASGLVNACRASCFASSPLARLTSPLRNSVHGALLNASFRTRLEAAPLPFANPSPPSGGWRTSTSKPSTPGTKRRKGVANRGALSASRSPIIWRTRLVLRLRALSLSNGAVQLIFAIEPSG
jgi:hypothetical protein